MLFWRRHKEEGAIARKILMVAGAMALLAPQHAIPRDIQTVSSMGAAERAQGAKAHPELLAEFGGLYNGPQAAYVSVIGRRIAVQSSLSSQQDDFTISLLNSSVNNAFAIPGGYVYVTRQLMALMNDEAELAGVLGHEIGHVAAQHSKKRQSAATRNSILGVLGQVLVGAVAGNSGFGQLLQKGIGTGAQLLTLKFSRSQEYEADDLGIRYLAQAGYDPTALSSMLASLAAQTSLDTRLRGSNQGVPEWASTHPDPASRVNRALANARATGSKSTMRNAATFMGNLDGLLYGDDPKEGLVEGNRFLHPAFRLQFAIPSGLTVENGTTAVSIVGSSGQAQFTATSYDGDLDRYVNGIFSDLAGQGAQVPNLAITRTTINGLPVGYATTRANNAQGQALDVTVVAYQFARNKAYHFLIATPAGQGLGPFRDMVSSMSRMTDKEASAVKPRIVRVVTVKRGDSQASLASRMAYSDYQLDRFRVLNALRPNDSLTPGRKVKIITH